MKTQLRARDHHVLRGEVVIDVLYDGRLIATVTGADEPGVRVVSKYALEAGIVLPGTPNVMEVRVEPG